MDQLKMRRKVCRSQSTRIYNTVNILIGQENPDINTIRTDVNHLQIIHDNLDELDKNIVELLYQENSTFEVLDKEATEVNEYKRKLLLVQQKLQDMELCYNASKQIPITNNDVSNEKRNFKLPKIQLKTFSGDLKDWLGFWSQFEKIHNDNSLHDSDKMQYLIMAMEPGSEAREIVESYPQTGGNYPLAIEALKERYGDEDLLLQVYVRELLKLVITNATTEDKLPIQHLYLKIESHLRSLKTLNLSQADPDTWIYPLVESSVPEEILLAWQRSTSTISQPTKTSRVDSLMTFLKSEVQIQQKIRLAQSGFEGKLSVHTTSNDKKKIKKEREPTLSNFQVTESKECIFCGKNHEAKDCIIAQKMTMQQKKNKLKEKRCCMLCFKPKHIARQCRAFIKCVICSKRHNALMCPEREIKSDNSPRETATNIKVDTVAVGVTKERNKNVVLQTLMVEINNNGKTRMVRAFLDSGSQRSYILKEVASDLGLNPIAEERVIHSLFGGATTGSINHDIFSVRLQKPGGGYHCDVKLRSQNSISKSIPKIRREKMLMKELKDHKIWISDVGESTPEVEVLLGADFYAKLLTGKIIHLSKGIMALETYLGWTLLGGGEHSSTSMIAYNIDMSVSDKEVAKLWDLEVIGVRDPNEVKSMVEKEAEVKKEFFEALERKEDGRYIVRLPWKKGHPQLPTNKEIAVKRLQSATRKLLSADNFELYGNIFQNWLNENFIEEVTEESQGTMVHYLPQRPVFKPESLTTPVRPVFDASCKVGKQPSLNECLEKGESYIQKIPELLLRFREKKVAFTADIRKAFQMIDVHPEDRDVMRFLWWTDKSLSKLRIFRHVRVMFGATCSPFALGAVLEYHLRNIKGENRSIAVALLNSFYVDNCVMSLGSYKEYLQFKEKAIGLLAEAQMELRLWMSNEDPEIEGDDISILGLKWCRMEDTLYVDVSACKLPEVITKRNILSTVQKIFDPIGFTAPATISMRILLQEVWVAKAKWDAPLPEEIRSRFITWHQEVPEFFNIRIPRLATLGKDEDKHKWSLHIFTDASQRAYAASVLLCIDEGSHRSVHFLTAKARVAPLNRPTIPRLELLGCLLGSYLGNTVKEAWNLSGVQIYYWTDSTVALAWIQRDECWSTFVGNRVAKIRQLSNIQDWRHISGTLNHADFLTRGCSPTELKKSRWWEGPCWLYESKETWLNKNEVVDEEGVEKEKRKTPVPVVVTSVCIVEEVRYNHTYSQYIRIWAYVRRFISNCLEKRRLRRKRGVTITKEEEDDTEIWIIKQVQKEAFPDHNKLAVPGVIDKQGIVRVKTRIIMREDLLNFKYPILLPKSHPVVQKLIQETHEKNGHAGVGTLVSLLRERMWILQCRRSVKKIVDRCVRCRRFKAKATIVEMAPLPKDRVTDAEVFQIVGVDLAGPLHLKHGGKVWVVIFTCAVYRAVYLDIVTSLKTESFIQVMKRFIQQYRRPEVVYSDNGTNFVGADNFFRKNINTKIIPPLQPINWKFNPPSAAWWGGMWERLIRTMKDIMKRMIGKAILKKQELEIIIKEVERIMNSRPLTTQSEDPEELTALTPMHFLKVHGEFRFPEGELSEASRLRIRMKYVQELKESLRGRFRKEYLGQLIDRPGTKKNTQLRVGEVVLIENDHKRIEWLLGRILELIPGRDGVCRVAVLKTKNGTCTRPIQRLYKMELREDGQQQKGREDVQDIL